MTDFSTATADVSEARPLEVGGTGAASAEDYVGRFTSEEDDLGAVWDKFERDNGAERDKGKFTSPDPEKREQTAQQGEPDPLAGGKGEGDAEPVVASSDAAAIPLPQNWKGMEDAWNKVPADIRADIAARDRDLHARMSDQGRDLASLKPLGAVVSEFKEYFDGTKGKYNPAEATRYLFGLQRAIDQDAPGTILGIIDTYGAREKVAALLGVQVGPQSGNEALHREIAGLKQQMAAANSPATVKAQIDQRFHEEAAANAARETISRLSQDKPLFDRIPEKRMVRFIEDAWDVLGDTASQEAVFNAAYRAAVDADPILKTEAAKLAAAAQAAAKPQDTARVANAKAAASVNVTSTTSGKPRKLTEDEELAAVYDRVQQKG